MTQCHGINSYLFYKAKSRFPTESYMVETFKTLQVRAMTAEEVGEKIAKHCDGNQLIFTININKANIENEAISLATGLKGMWGKFIYLLQTYDHFCACKA